MNSRPIRLKSETFELIDKAKDDFLKSNRKFRDKGITISYDFILTKVLTFYLEN